MLCYSTLLTAVGLTPPIRYPATLKVSYILYCVGRRSCIEHVEDVGKNASLGSGETPRVVFDLSQKKNDVLKTATTISTCTTIKL